MLGIFLQLRTLEHRARAEFRTPVIAEAGIFPQGEGQDEAEPVTIFRYMRKLALACHGGIAGKSFAV